MATITSPRPQSPASTTRSTIVQSPTLASPALTPSSSIRASFDFPTIVSNGRAVSPAATAGAPPAARRNRAALRDYYNLKTGSASSSQRPEGNLTRTASTGSESTVTSTNNNDTNAPTSAAATAPELDSPSFDAQSYVSQILRTEDLKSILKIECSLISEIRQVDGERKALVYDNYSKLISATRTIGQMQRGMNERGGLESIDKLRPGLEGMERFARELGGERAVVVGGKEDGNISVRRRREEREKKELVRWVIEAPGRLGKMVAEGNEEDVAKEWEVVSRLLEQWKGVRGVDEVRAKCEAVMEDVKRKEEPEG